MEMDRRSFLKGAAAVGAISVTAGLAACTPDSGTEANGGSTNTGTGTASGYLTEADLNKKWAFEIAPDPIGDDLIGETKEAEIIVIGAGTAGLSAAVSAAEAGAKVILFAMGSAPIGRGGSNFAFHSKFRESLKLDPVPFFPYMRVQSAGNNFNFSQRKWKKWYENSEHIMNWLIDIMAEPGVYALYLEQTLHGMILDPNNPDFDPLCTHDWILPGDGVELVGDGQPYVVKTLAEKALSLGVEIDYNVTAQQLVRGGQPNGKSGRVDAVIAQDKDGNYIKYKGSKAIVMATGDFSRDKDMMRRYCPQAWDWFWNYDADEDFDPEDGKIYGGLYTGQGQKMGLWVGASWQKGFPNTSMASLGHAGADNIGFLVDHTGKRFCSEGAMSGGYLSLAYRQVFKGKIGQIWNEAYAETGQPWPRRKSGYGQPFLPTDEILKTWDDKVADGTYVKADTVEEVVDKLGLPKTTVDEFKKYNEYCKAGFDPEFFKPKEAMVPFEGGPYYGSYSDTVVNTLTVCGGLRTNDDMQVCDADDEAIPGLYNVGTMIGDSVSGTCYSFKIPGFNLGMNCLTFGYLTGKFIAENE